MKLRLRSVAEADAAEAMRWCAEQKPDLASRSDHGLQSLARDFNPWRGSD